MNAIFRQVVFFAIKLGCLNYRFLSGHVAPYNILITQQKQVQGLVARSMVSANHWLRGIKTYGLSWHLTRVSANHASSNWAQTDKT